MTRLRWQLRYGQDGATAVEYSIMAMAIAAVVVAIVLLLGRQTRENFCATGTAFGEAPSVEPKNDEKSCLNQNA